MNSATAEVSFEPAELPARRGFDPAALAALFVLTLRQHVHGRRLLILSLLFLLPGVLVVVAKIATVVPPPERLEFMFIFNFIPHALAPLAALLYAAGIIQDEVEEQTLTYLLLRPLPRRALYLTKLVATWLVTSLLIAVFTTLTFVVVWWGTPQLWEEVLPSRAAKTAGLMALAQVGYCSLFGALGLFTRRSLLVGLAYIVGFEGLLSNLEMVARQMTVMFYFRVLGIRWLAPAENKSWSKDWSIDLKSVDIPSASACVQVLLIGSAVLAICGMVMMAGREFRMKTPEGN
jgi:ABC-2 type transport system permease protein